MWKKIWGIILPVLLLVSINPLYAQGPDDGPDEERPDGVTILTDEVTDGYILIPIIQSSTTLLLSNDGRIVKTWEGDYTSAYSTYLQDDGGLIRAVSLPDPPFGPSGPWTYMSGRIEYFDWDGNLLKTLDYGTDQAYPHHDYEVLPNGNILWVTYDLYTNEEALAAGRNPELLPEIGYILSDKIIELDTETGDIVWEWRAWDHLVQDFDENQANYGVIAENPGRIDINYVYEGVDQDWLHMNSVKYNAELDQIVMSPKHFNEVWIADHSLTTAETETEAGDLIYRWGNPAAHGVGTKDDQQLFGQHTPHWIADGLPGAGHILVYDNGDDTRPYSRAVEFETPLQEDGTYGMVPNEPTLPAEPTWFYQAENTEDFYSNIISSAQRFANGNTLITEGANGRLFEVNADNEIVWEYYLPPGARAFRSARYDLSAFADFDQGQDLSEELGFYIRWGQDCADGEQPRLYAYLDNNAADMALFIETHGDDAQSVWEEESCAEHGGLAE